MSKRFNGGIIGLSNLTKSSGVTTGIWTLSEVLSARLAFTWPGNLAGIQIFTETMNWTAPPGVTSVEYLLVAGGGRGCRNYYSPGRGAGGGGPG